MKFFSLALFLVVTAIPFNPTVVFGQDSLNDVPPESVVAETVSPPTLSLENVAIATQEGNAIKVLYQVGSPDGIVPDVRLSLALRPVGVDTLVFVDEHVMPAPLTLGPENSPIMSMATYDAPAYLTGTYELFMLARSANGRVIAVQKAGEVTLTASVPLTADCTAGEQLTCTFTNTGTASMTLEPSFLTTWRSAHGDPVATGPYTPTPITLAGGEKQTVTLDVPKATQPDTYAVVATFTDTNTNTVAYAVPFSYLAEGPRAHFTDVTFDRIPTEVGDTVQVYAGWSINDKSLYPATLQASIGDATGACSTFVNQSITAGTQTLVVPLTLTRLCPEGKLAVSLVQTDVKTLAAKTYALALYPAVAEAATEAAPTTEPPVTTPPESGAPILLVVLALLLIAAVIGYLIYQKKTPSPTPTILPLFFLLFASAIFFAPVGKAEAGNVSFSFNCTTTDCPTNSTISMTFDVQDTVAPGGQMSISMSIASDDAPQSACPMARYSLNGGGSYSSDYEAGCYTAEEYRNGVLKTHTITAPSTEGTYSFCVNASPATSGYQAIAPKCTSYQVIAPTCSFTGDLYWFDGTGLECSVFGVSYSNVTSGQTRTANDTNASGNTYTGSITFLCNAGAWEYQTADCNSNFACQASIPANGSAWDAEESSGLANNSTNWTYAGADSSTKCEYRCNAGYEYNSGSCLPISYSCQGNIPANASAWDAEESSGLANNTTYWSNASSDTATKCQYRCGTGYTYSGGSCVPDVTASCGAAAKTYAYNASSYTGAFCGTGNSVSPASPSFPAQGGSTSWTCYGTYDSGTCTAWRDSPPSFSCTGSDPMNATLCLGDSTGLSADTGKTVVNSCTAGTKCEFTCGSGYTNSGGTCVATATYSCQASIPVNGSAWDAEESASLANNTTNWSYAASDTATKCQYRCDAGYAYSSGTCVSTSAYPDLSAAPPTFPTGSVQQSGTINFTGTITNVGSALAGTYSNDVFYIDANGDGSHEYTVSASAVTNTTAVGDSRTTTGGWNVPATAPVGNNYRVGYYADTNNDIDEGSGDGPWANWSGWSASFSVTSAASFACQASIPVNGSAWDAEESASLANNSTNWTYAGTDTATKCQYRCDAGYAYSAGACVATATYSCTGTDPTNATLCSGDSTGLSANTAKTVVNSCTAGTKCEFTCGSGYTNSGGVCVATAVTSGDISATNCTIPTGAGNCQSTVSWTSSGITPSVRQNGLQFSTVSSNNVSRTIGKGTTFFSIWNTGIAPETMEDFIGVTADCDLANAQYNTVTGLCEAYLKPTITASPQVVQQTNPASNSTISWTLGNYLAADCSLSGPGLTAQVAALSQSIPIAARSTYTITCGNAPPVSASVTVEVRPKVIET